MAGVLGPGVGKAVCWFLPAPWGRSVVGVGSERGLTALGVLQLRPPAPSTRNSPSPAPTRLPAPTLGALDDVARGQESAGQSALGKKITKKAGPRESVSPLPASWPSTAPRLAFFGGDTRIGLASAVISVGEDSDSPRSPGRHLGDPSHFKCKLSPTPSPFTYTPKFLNRPPPNLLAS